MLYLFQYICIMFILAGEALKMTGHNHSWQNAIIKTVFVICTAACSLPSQHAEEAKADPSQSTAVQPAYILPTAVQNFYLDGRASERCSTIDGQGTTSSSVTETVEEIRTTLGRFPLGHAAVLDLRRSGTILCFESSGIPDIATGAQRNAEYRRDLNMLRSTDSDPWRVIHEWKHKWDDIDFNSFHYSPRSAILALRFAEAGAYSFEVMSRQEARSYGVAVSPYPSGSPLDQVERAYVETLSRGGTKEQAWRSAFETTFNNGMLSGYTETVLSAYERAVNYAPLRQSPNFARTSVSDEGLITYALPPGWTLESFRRTGSTAVSSDFHYSGNTLNQEERLQTLERALENKAPQRQTAPPIPHN